MILVSGLFLLALGCLAGYQLANLPKMQVMHKNKAIQRQFDVKGNEYNYIPEGVEDYYILSVNDQEYRIKFSTNKPTTVVFSEELIPVEE